MGARPIRRVNILMAGPAVLYTALYVPGIGFSVSGIVLLYWVLLPTTGNGNTPEYTVFQSFMKIKRFL